MVQNNNRNTTAPQEDLEAEAVKAEAVAEENKILKESIAELMKRLERVEYAADKAHLARFDERNKESAGKTVKLRLLDGKVITSWDNMPENTVEKNPLNQQWFERQTVRIHFEDKTSADMDLVVFNRRFTHIVADVISESRVTEGDQEKVTFKVRTLDGRDYEIDQKFVN